jgi:orotidine 5'-phosphate decarboxylase subfamily 1
MKDDEMKHPKLYVAIDTPDLAKAEERARMVNDVEGDFGFKINLDLIVLNGGVGTVYNFREKFGRQIFPDLKMWNGGRTMSALAVGLAEAGASLTNIYAQSGVKFMRRVVNAVRESGHNMDIFGLGVLTHYTDADCLRLYGRNLSDSVRYFAEETAVAELNGYIQPGTCLNRTNGMIFKRLVPAVRPAWYDDPKANDQEQDVTPEEAFSGGANIIICGSPIFKSPDPQEALAKILAV